MKEEDGMKGIILSVGTDPRSVLHSLGFWPWDEKRQAVIMVQCVNIEIQNTINH